MAVLNIRRIVMKGALVDNVGSAICCTANQDCGQESPPVTKHSFLLFRLDMSMM